MQVHSADSHCFNVGSSMNPVRNGRRSPHGFTGPGSFRGNPSGGMSGEDSDTLSESKNPIERRIWELIDHFLILLEDWESLPKSAQKEIQSSADEEQLLSGLEKHGLLTAYQVGRIEAKTIFGLIIANYRVLDRLGAGGMGVVFRAEHMRMRKLVAIKVLPLSPEQDRRILGRFYTEMRAIAKMQHANIVTAFDAGEVLSNDGSGNVLHYLAMEYVPGQDLEEYIRSHGPMDQATACDVMHQVASALTEAHANNLVHRDIKPSNIIVTPEGQAKLLDFGLARHFSEGITEPGMLLGTLDYMPPEQAQDAHSVDIRGDLYSLGGVFYWCLTGRPPFPSRGNVVKDLQARLEQQPPSIRETRPEISEDLDKLIKRLMANNPNDRFGTPKEFSQALVPLLKPDLHDGTAVPKPPSALEGIETIEINGRSAHESLQGKRIHRVLVVDDEPGLLTFCRAVLQSDGLECDEADGGLAALDAVQEKRYDLIVLDINMGDIRGTEVLKRLRKQPPSPNLKIIMASGNNNADLMAKMLLSGADDFITKPFSVWQLRAKVKSALRLKEAQDRTDLLHQHLVQVNRQLEDGLKSRNSDLAEARNALVLSLAKLIEHRVHESGDHVDRVQRYCRRLAETAALHSSLRSQITPEFIDLLECCAPLYDIGTVGLPDSLLLKPGRLEVEERVMIQTHTTIGAETLMEVAENHPSAKVFLQMAVEVARHHHERYDGTGYPDGLAGDDIPLSARIVTIADVYDALRSRRPYKPPLSHAAVVQVMLSENGSQFDPALMEAFQQCESEFARIFQDGN